MCVPFCGRERRASPQKGQRQVRGRKGKQGYKQLPPPARPTRTRPPPPCCRCRHCCRDINADIVAGTAMQTNAAAQARCCSMRKQGTRQLDDAMMQARTHDARKLFNMTECVQALGTRAAATRTARHQEASALLIGVAFYPLTRLLSHAIRSACFSSLIR